MMLVILGFVFLTFGIFIPIDYLVGQAMSAGMSSYLAQYLVSMLNAARCVQTRVFGFHHLANSIRQSVRSYVGWYLLRQNWSL